MSVVCSFFFFFFLLFSFFFNDTATTEIYTLSLHDALPISEKKRIIEQRLSPLYISVHSTDREIRNTLLGNNNAADIMKELKWLAKNRIRIHVQIVLCPGYNDGDKLMSTINDLHKFYPYVSSIAVVPVGLTRHRKFPLKPVGKDEAQIGRASCRERV